MFKKDEPQPSDSDPQKSSEPIDPKFEVMEELSEKLNSEKSPDEPVNYKKKADEYLDQLVRLQAEFANYRKRSEREKSEAIRFGQETMLEQMIQLVDIMEQALHHSKSASDVESLKKGFEMVISEFLRFMKSEGAESLKTVGEKFDPHMHEAIEQIPTEKAEEDNRIVAEIQKGYNFNGRLLRPAKVKVAKLKKSDNGDKQ